MIELAIALTVGAMVLATVEVAQTIDPAIVERVLLEGDLKHLKPAQKVSWYTRVCESTGLNPLTQPFAYIVLNGKEVLYAKREATEQLRRLHKVSIQITSREVAEGCYVVTARASLPDGRSDENIGAVPIEGLKGEARSNALMKAETKAKRRVTLSICGLGMLDETEVESLPPTVAYTVEADPPSLDAGQVVADTVQNPAPTPADALYIIRVEKVATKKANVFQYYVTFSNHLKTVTIQEWLAAVCEQFAQQNIPVKIETKETPWSKRKDGTVVPDLVKVHRADEPEQPHLEPLTADDIPF